MKKIRLLAASAILAFAAISNSFAQNDLGKECGCPLVSARGAGINLSSFADADGVLTSNLLLTCDKLYILDKKIYVPWGKTLTIMPGTVVKADPSGNPSTASAIVVMRGGKIFANGSQTCPIVFTASADPMDGSYAITNTGKWGGIVILGRAKNNLIGSNGSSVSPDSTGIGWVEGYPAASVYNHYGMKPGFEVSNDNSGILRYVSIRHAGAIVTGANELNGLTLASVGSGTTIDYIDIVANADDGIEFFGGTVNVKHIAMWWGNDDMFDWDLGWIGNGQFLFGIQCPDIALLAGGDNGFESDGDDNTKGDAAGFMSHPVIYNATLIGNGLASSSDFSGPSALRAKERTEGEIYNSILANFRYGFDLNNKRTALATPPGTTDAYTNWINGSLLVKNNTWVNVTGGLGVLTVTQATGPRAAGSASDLSKFTTDGNTYLTSVPGFDYTFAMSGGAITHKFDAVPLPEISSTITPSGSFFSPVSYRGAFASNEKSWLSDWSYGKLTNSTTGLVICPNDVDNSGAINSDDLLQVLGAFGTSCAK